MASNSGFRPQEIQRRKFQEAAAVAIDKQANAISQTREFMADLSTRLDDTNLRMIARFNKLEREQLARNIVTGPGLRGRLSVVYRLARWVVTGRPWRQ